MGALVMLEKSETKEMTLLDQDNTYLRIVELLKNPEDIPFYTGRGTPPILIYDKEGVRLFQNQYTKEIYKVLRGHRFYGDEDNE